MPPKLKKTYEDRSGLFSEHHRSAFAFGGADAIHEMRVCLKRLRTFFNLVEAVAPSFHADEIFRPARRFFRAAGKLRHVQVLQFLTLRLVREFELDLSEYYNMLKAEEPRERKRFARACGRFDSRFFESAGATIADRLESLPEDRVRQAAEMRLGSLLNDVKAGIRISRDPDRLHWVRIRTKEARYTLEIMVEAGLTEDKAENLDGLLKSVHQPLGRWRDGLLALESLREFGAHRASGALFCSKSYPEAIRILKLDIRKNLGEFKENRQALAGFLSSMSPGPAPDGASRS
ncbi:MAG: CHAD domain-containing protein [Acidobacteriota bacterium]|nr:CHAD domain-containing protein [Acidobacteriota bacterium]